MFDPLYCHGATDKRQVVEGGGIHTPPGVEKSSLQTGLWARPGDLGLVVSRAIFLV